MDFERIICCKFPVTPTWQVVKPIACPVSEYSKINFWNIWAMGLIFSGNVRDVSWTKSENMSSVAQLFRKFFFVKWNFWCFGGLVQFPPRPLLFFSYFGGENHCLLFPTVFKLFLFVFTTSLSQVNVIYVDFRDNNVNFIACFSLKSPIYTKKSILHLFHDSLQKITREIFELWGSYFGKMFIKIMEHYPKIWDKMVSISQLIFGIMSSVC